MLAMELSSKKEYYIRGDSVFWHHDFEFNGHVWSVVQTGDGDFQVFLKRDLKPYEETYHYQEQQKKKQELEILSVQRKDIAYKIQKDAFKALQNRLGLNMLFGENDKLSTLGVVVVTEFGKIIKDLEVKPLKDNGI